MEVLWYDTAKDRLAKVDSIINGKQARKTQIELCILRVKRVHPHLSVFGYVPSSEIIRFLGELFSNDGNLRKNPEKLFLAELDKLENITEFHENTWYALLDYMTVYDKGNIRFTFKDGTQV